MGSRIDRLERLDELRRSGALTDAEYEHEKVRTLQGSIVDPPQVPVESAAWVATEADDTPVSSGIRASWAASPLGRNKPLAMAIAIVSALLLGLLLRSLFVAGLWLAVCSASAYWLYTGLRIEQKPQHEEGTAPWRVCFYVACGLVLLGVVLPRITGGSSGLNTAPAATEVASTDDPEAEQVSEAPSAGVGSRMSCRSAMEVAAVASCGIQLERLKAGNLLFGGAYKPQVEGYQRSLRQVSPPLNSLCGDAVSTGTNAAAEGTGNAWEALTSKQVDTRTAVRMCAMGAKPRMDEFCEYNGTSCS